MRRHLLTIAVILTAATGCDNVAWGGVEWRLTPPATTDVDTLSEAAELAEEPALRVYGPLLLAGTLSGGRATLAVVGDVQAEGLLALDPSPGELERVALLAPAGSEWTLFADGVRVGRMFVDETSTSAAYCPARPTVSGIVELVPSASAAERLLALPSSIGEPRPHVPFEPMDHVYEQRAATIAWATDAIPRYRASWPEVLVQARQDIRVFEPLGAPGPAVAATFMYRDRLSVTPAAQGSYALFLLGSRRGGEYREDFAWYRPAAEGGKGAPRYFDHLDWDGDGNAEILLEVLGAERRWFAALARRNGQWVRTFLDACGASPAAGG
jgi:hypothetical protein